MVVVVINFIFKYY